MKLILAQGNPEKRYDGTRHNIGFSLIDDFADQHNAQWTDAPKFHSRVATLTFDDEKVLLAKPTTFYNETGQAARALVDFYKLNPAQDVLVIHDDLALPFGTLRVRSKGSDAGNNGIKNITAHLGQEYRRIRVGIWNDSRNRMDDVAFVLAKLHQHEHAQLSLLSQEVSRLITLFLSDELTDHSTKIVLAE